MMTDFVFLSDMAKHRLSDDGLGFEPIIHVVVEQLQRYAQDQRRVIEERAKETGKGGSRQRSELDELDGALLLGVEGGWGTGKTTFMQMLRSELDRRATARKDRLPATTLRINIWKYRNREEVWSSILQQVLAKLPPGVLRQAARHWADVAGVALDSFFSTLRAGRPFKELRDALPREDFSHDFEEPLRVALADHLTEELNRKRKKSQWLPEIVVIFIDDLDRCGPDTVKEVLEALKLYLDLPCLVFVLGYDRDRVAEALGAAYGIGEGKGSDLREARDWGNRYLRKIVSAVIPLPPAGRERFRAYATQCVRELSPAGIRSLDLDPILELLLPVVRQNPRTLKKILNRMAGRILALEERQAPATPERALAMAILHELWPTFASVLGSRHGGLTAVLEAVIGRALGGAPGSPDPFEEALLGLGFGPGEAGRIMNDQLLLWLLGQMATMDGSMESWEAYVFNEESVVSRYNGAKTDKERKSILVGLLTKAQVDEFNHLHRYISGTYSPGLLDLSKIKIPPGTNLSGADLSECDLRGAKLERVILENARFEGSDLRGAWLAGANLAGAVLAGADLEGARVAGTRFEGADLTRARNVPPLDVTTHGPGTSGRTSPAEEE